MKLSLRLSSDLAPDTIREAARGAVTAGMERVWLADNPRERSSIVTASYLAAREPSLGIGLGIVSARERHPVILTQEALALQAYCERPLILGLGLGDDLEKALLGLENRSGLGLLRETTAVVRALATGGEVAAFDGSDQTFGLKFEGKLLPVYVGAIGPKTLRLAGEIADGIVLSLGTTAVAASTAVRTAGSAERAPGLGANVHTVCYVAFGGLGDDAPKRMQPFVAHILAAYAARPAFGVLLEGTGVDAQEAGRLAAAYQDGMPLPADLVAGMTLAGSVDHCLERIAGYQAAGVDEIALGMGRWNTSLAETLADAKRLVAALGAS